MKPARSVFFAVAACCALLFIAIDAAAIGTEVVVTRGPKSADTASPITVLDADEFSARGATSVADLINELPSSSVDSTGALTGTATQNLRGIGSTSTLVLINGRRPRLTTGNEVIDLNAIPLGVIERIEVLPDAGGAIYGSDAISGVVNVLLKNERCNSGAYDDLEAAPVGGCSDPAGTDQSGFNFFGNTTFDYVPQPVLPGLGIYDTFGRNFSGSIDFDSLCDFGSGGTLPGTFLSPWLSGSEYLRNGDNFFIPFLQPDPAPDTGTPEPEPDSAAPADTNTPGSADGAGAPATADAADTDTAPADGAGSATDSDGGDQPAQPAAAPPPLTALQQWDRGVPPWSLVQRSPEVAHLLPLLRPYYQLRMQQNGIRLALDSHDLSDYERSENRDEFQVAFELWQGTRREIITILADFINPDIAATIETGDPIWGGNAGPALPADVFSDLFPEMGSVVHPSQKAAQAAQDAALQAEADSLPTLDAEDSAAGAGNTTDGLRIGITGLYGSDFGFNDFSLSTRYADPESVPAVDEAFKPQVGFQWPALTDGLSVQPYLGQYEYDRDGGASVKPLEGGIFDPSYPYEYKFRQPIPGGLGDWEFNSDLPSDRGFGGADGRVQYGDTSFDIDSYLTPSQDPSRVISPSRLDELRALPQWPTVAESLVEAGDASRRERDAARYFFNRSRDYDFRVDFRNSLMRSFFRTDRAGIDYDRLKRELQAPSLRELFVPGFNAGEHRIGYNLQTGAGAITIPLNKYEGLTVRGTGSQCSGMPGAPGDDAAGNAWRQFQASQWRIDNDCYTSYRWAEGAAPQIDITQLFGANAQQETDYCATEAFPVGGSLNALVNGQAIDDDWFMERISVTESVPGAPITVAIIDTGLDYHHLDISWDQLWYNSGEIRDNGIDDDGNGFVDDIFGWDFTVNSNTPWDHDGHGTFVTGLIAAKRDNLSGIDGINPHARIMVLKALNNFGHTRASWLAQAIVYATDNGARIINLSAAGPGLPEFVQDAIDYADRNGVLVFVAAGNTAENVDGIGPAGLDKVITVAATGLDDSRAPFSNWGNRIDIAAPGMHIKSLRARQTDFRLTSLDGPYKRGSAILDVDRRAYRADGTSFAAPLVAGAASLIWSQNPTLTHTEVRRMLEQSARDIDTPGRDQFTGYGLLNAAAALAADPAYFTLAQIDGVAIAVVDGRQVARVTGTTSADKFAGAVLEIGQGDNPDKWKRIGKPLGTPVSGGVLGDIPPQELQGSAVWTVRIVTEHKNKSVREARYRLNIGG